MCLLGVVGSGLRIGVRIGHDKILLCVETGLIYVIDVWDWLGELACCFGPAFA
jgi:hypothetical protein